MDTGRRGRTHMWARGVVHVALVPAAVPVPRAATSEQPVTRLHGGGERSAEAHNLVGGARDAVPRPAQFPGGHVDRAAPKPRHRPTPLCLPPPFPTHTSIQSHNKLAGSRGGGRHCECASSQEGSAALKHVHMQTPQAAKAPAARTGPRSQRPHTQTRSHVHHDTHRVVASTLLCRRMFMPKEAEATHTASTPQTAARTGCSFVNCTARRHNDGLALGGRP
jgi:hypothetical protein